MLFSMVSLLLQQVKTAGIAGHRSLMLKAKTTTRTSTILLPRHLHIAIKTIPLLSPDVPASSRNLSARGLFMPLEHPLVIAIITLLVLLAVYLMVLVLLAKGNL